MARGDVGRQVTLLPPKEMYADVPLGLRALLLNQLAIVVSTARLVELEFEADPREYADEADRIRDELYMRNARGSILEEDGKTDEAIVLYEASVADMFDGNHPYDRLRTIYTEREQYGEALRVCRRFVEMADVLVELDSPRGDLLTKRQKFLEWCKKLEARLEKQRGSAV